jgi:hypothetical protein
VQELGLALLPDEEGVVFDERRLDMYHRLLCRVMSSKCTIEYCTMSNIACNSAAVYDLTASCVAVFLFLSDPPAVPSPSRLSRTIESCGPSDFLESRVLGGGAREYISVPATASASDPTGRGSQDQHSTIAPPMIRPGVAPEP